MASPTTAPPLGFRLSYLRHFINEQGGEASFAGKTTAQVCFEFVVPLTMASQLSLVDHVANDPTTASFVAPANWYVSHAWQYLFLETVDSLERFFADRGLSDDAVIWFCVFNNNQHLAATQSFASWSTTFKDSLATIGNVVMIMHPWNDPIVLRRSWCVFEVYVAVTLGARFEIALAQDQEATFLDDIADDGAFYKMLATIKSENSQATILSDRDGIFDLIRAETSFQAVDRLIFSTLSNWIKTTLEASIASTPSLVKKAARWLHLGGIHISETNPAESERCFHHAIDLFTQANGPNDLETLVAQSALGAAMASQHKPRSEWAPCFEATLSAQARFFGPAHATTLQTRLRFATALAVNNDPSGSLAVNLETLDLERDAYGLNDKGTAGTLRSIGANYLQLHQLRVGARYLRRALALHETFYGEDHPVTMATAAHLVGVLIHSGHAKEALPRAARLAALNERMLGPAHSDTIRFNLSLASAELMAGNTTAAKTQLVELEIAMTAKPQLQGPLQAVHVYLAVAYWAECNYDEAAKYFVRAVDGIPNKTSAWLLFMFAADAPRVPAVEAALQHARSYLASTEDKAPETWPVTCLACCMPIVGRRVVCAGCPNGLYRFCTGCVDRRYRRVQRFCAHDPSATAFKTTLPPMRFFFEADLGSSDASYDEVDGLYGAYETYCDAHSVPRHERLPRTSVPILNRSWHPMV
ncbi:hypothetical protein SPRG_12265 [Saprolegnia parasitica CBS 223.65]|uniref:Uncharacterized protein n=1 Tax=Saprolegnia parasitica (strain CBS 223.65) TaxID=695850 RepID=A0A067C7V8_SAPPC|nr:hypothetical protein SPRG_12265 [Saprolegnia parasitica CBS 223.65]KDO22626.1 hypothetical protein SPRG_12265 [Saprolegnia parasitica CBS 223.65]|eukprot:XP_012206645.1 hypothetical protein SPRG_12265 [Saprolegnia parasitica CBS 223.65]